MNIPNSYFSSTRVGILTSNASYSFQVGGNPLVSGGGVSISDDGFIRIANDISTVRHINSTGIVTTSGLDVNGSGDFSDSISVASSITGATLYGNGSNITDLNLDNVTNGSISGSRIDPETSISMNKKIIASSFGSGTGSVAISTSDPGDGLRVYFTDPASGLSTSFRLY